MKSLEAFILFSNFYRIFFHLLLIGVAFERVVVSVADSIATLSQLSSMLSFKRVVKYWVILKKVSFGIFGSILVSKEETNFTIKSKDKGLSLSKFS